MTHLDKAMYATIRVEFPITETKVYKPMKNLKYIQYTIKKIQHLYQQH